MPGMFRTNKYVVIQKIWYQAGDKYLNRLSILLIIMKLMTTWFLCTPISTTRLLFVWVILFSVICINILLVVTWIPPCKALIKLVNWYSLSVRKLNPPCRWPVVCYTYLHTPSDWSAWPQFSGRGRADLNHYLMYTSGPTGPKDRHRYQISCVCQYL